MAIGLAQSRDICLILLFCLFSREHSPELDLSIHFWIGREMMAHQAEGPMEVTVFLHVLRHRGRVELPARDCKYFSDLYGDATSCTYISYSGEESNSYQRRYLNVHDLRFYPAVCVCTSSTKMVTRVCWFVVEMRKLDEGRKWTGTCSLCQLPRNEQSDSWELISSAQVRTIDGSNAEAKNYIKL